MEGWIDGRAEGRRGFFYFFMHMKLAQNYDASVSI
jgi:hypothetical protein